MSRIIYVNGRYLRREQAFFHVEDRGYLFADGVYDAFELRNKQIIDLERHLVRLYRSMKEIRLSEPPRRKMLEHVLKETVRRNRYANGFIYIQVTRGVARRDFRFPTDDTPKSILCIVYNSVASAMDKLANKGIDVITCPDLRWKRRDIKSILLLPSVLAKQTASEQGAFEAWMLDEQGFVTEGASSNAWIITKNRELITRQKGSDILAGITRRAVLELVEKEQLKLIERPFSLAEALEAQEAFITACSITVMPVVKIDNNLIGSGKAGPLTLRLRKLYQERTTVLDFD